VEIEPVNEYEEFRIGYNVPLVTPAVLAMPSIVGNAIRAILVAWAGNIAEQRLFSFVIYRSLGRDQEASFSVFAFQFEYQGDPDNPGATS